MNEARTRRLIFRSGRATILAFILLAQSFAFALDVPALRGRVNDYAGLISADRAQALENRLASFEKETGHQIAVLTVPSLEGDPLEDFGIRLAESWKIGQKGFDNGAILIVAQKDRKLRIEVGYGLEGVLPDAIASRIIREAIVPRFRENDYAGGIEAGLDALMSVARGENLVDNTEGSRSGLDINLVWVLIALICILRLPRTIMWRLVVPASRARGALVGVAVGTALGGLTGAAAMILGAHISLYGIALLFLLAILMGVISGLQGYLRASRRFGKRTDIRWNEPFYIGGDGFSMARRRQSSSGVGMGGSSVTGTSTSGFSGGGGGFGGGGASGSW